jgi:tetratricopeptide (TPR) repeat protein
LRALAAKGGSEATTLNRERFLHATLSHRADWLRDEFQLRELKGSQTVLDHLRVGGAHPGEVDYFQGELYRLRAEKNDAARAVAAYERALATGEAPPEVYRALGLVWMRAGERAHARNAFQQYLEIRPDADDRQMIRAYIEQLQ